ncbi:hypothetical protein EJB05_43907 [Eragrostis curvula]|uniref:HTH myb-type domain-containing protein n=1 Tax=Eragrostis curvula TaxID=38414 RepID=A0A5J9TGF7_9POAL|nr:hypothetical protein EJB05_43907 [Eragrostis curvula]
MGANAIQVWKTFEEKYFKSLFCVATSENPSTRMDVLTERFPAKTIQQPSDEYFDAIGDILCRDIDVEPISNGATSDLSDWYNLLGLGRWTLQFLHGIECFGRGKWKAISMHAVPSRTPAQLASHAHKYFKKNENNEQNDKRQRYIINDEREKMKPTESSIPPAMPTEDMNFLDDLTFLDDMNFRDDLSFLDDVNFLDDLVQGLPTFGQASNNATNVARQMTLNNDTPGSLQWEALSTCPTTEHGSILLDQTEGISAETRTGPSYGQSLVTGNQIRKDNIALPGVSTAQTPPEVLHYGQGGYNATNFPSEQPVQSVPNHATTILMHGGSSVAF